MNNLVWFRNNLRTQDNKSIFDACAKKGKVLGVYCVDPREYRITKHGFKKTEKFRTKFLLETLHELKSNLKDLNISLFVYFDTPENVIPQLVAKHQIKDIFVQKEWTPDELEVENEVRNLCPSLQWNSAFDQFLFHPSDIPYKEYASIPEVFTEFRKRCERDSRVRPCMELKAKHSENLLANETTIPTLEIVGFENFDTPENTAFPFKGGENQALKRIENYFFETENLAKYKQTRNGLIGEAYSSKLSAWLANGSISARKIYWEIKEFESTIIANDDTYWLIFELIWRDYFKYISLKHGEKIFKLDGILGKTYDWKVNRKAFDSWVFGNTREPFVNANMRELLNTGFMSNRGRQNVASYWAKEWEQDWRIAAAYFESMLIDYDVHSNYGNWIYNSGVGNDPRDRKFNIKRQAEMYDSAGKFQKLWNN